MLILLITLAHGIVLPGIQSKAYEQNAIIPVYMNEMTSVTNQIPYDYYILDQCQPEGGVKNKYENIGSILMGSKMQNSAYTFFNGINIGCEKLCERNLTQMDVNNFKWFIERNYRINMEIDSLPVIQNLMVGMQSQIEIGIPIGTYDDDFYQLHNHIIFEIEMYEEKYVNKITVNTFALEPIEIDGKLVPGCSNETSEDLNYSFKMPVELSTGPQVFSYEVRFTKTTNNTRYDIYKQLDQKDPEWTSVSLTFIFALILSILVGLLLILIVRRDILRFSTIATNTLNRNEEVLEEMQSWKQLSRDVFRPPVNKLLLSVLLGTGIQLMILLISVLFLSCFGFVYQAHSGNLATLAIVIYVFTGSLNGYYTAKFYKYFKGEYWLLCTLLGNLAFPSMALLVYVIQHIFLSLEDSSSVFSVKAALTFLALQIGIQTPLNLIGTFMGYKLEPAKNPCKYYKIAQYVHPQPWYLDTFYSCLFGGFVCFMSVGIELQYVMTLIWKHSYYEFFLSLFLSLMLLFLISALVSIIVVYISLIKQNHYWWWKAFLVPFSAGNYLFIYSVQYYLAQLTLTRLSAIVYYFGTMYLASLSLGLICGTIGLVSGYVFVHKIYSLIKVD